MSTALGVAPDRTSGHTSPVLAARVALARQRLTPRLPDDGAWGWVAPVLVMTLAGILRLWRLGEPSTLVFDEAHYVPDSQGMMDHGVEYDTEKRAADFVVHPPVGKWVIAAGQWIFGQDAFGWRFGIAVLGTLSVLMLARIARRMFGSTLLGCLAGLLLALDGSHFVHSRTALLDLVLMFFVLAAFGCLVVDRDATRARLARMLATDQPLPGGRTGPSLGLRPWRIAAGVCLGLACGTKWSGLWVVAAFGVLAVLWDVATRRTAGVEMPLLGTLRRDAVPAFASLVGVAAVVYLATWGGWFASDSAHAWSRGWAQAHPGPSLVPGALVSLWHYHGEMLGFHRNLHESHPYESNPWGWVVLARPTSFFYETKAQGEMGCQVAQCSRAITGLGNPLVWWAGLLALPACVALWVGRRDWRAGALLCGFASGYLPWFLFAERTIFAFYSIAFLPFVVLAVTLCAGLVLGPADGSPRRRTVGTVAVTAYVLLVVATFAYFYPVLSAEVIPTEDWQARMWFPSWI